MYCLIILELYFLGVYKKGFNVIIVLFNLLVFLNVYE